MAESGKSSLLLSWYLLGRYHDVRQLQQVRVLKTKKTPTSTLFNSIEPHFSDIYFVRFTAPVHLDAHLISLVDFFTRWAPTRELVVVIMLYFTSPSILASIVVFATLGNSAYELGVPVETVAKGGQARMKSTNMCWVLIGCLQGLAFVTYPEALSHLPYPQFWWVTTTFQLMFYSLSGLSGA